MHACILDVLKFGFGCQLTVCRHGTLCPTTLCPSMWASPAARPRMPPTPACTLHGQHCSNRCSRTPSIQRCVTLLTDWDARGWAHQGQADTHCAGRCSRLYSARRQRLFRSYFVSCVSYICITDILQRLATAMDTSGFLHLQPASRCSLRNQDITCTGRTLACTTFISFIFSLVLSRSLDFLPVCFVFDDFVTFCIRRSSVQRLDVELVPVLATPTPTRAQDLPINDSQDSKRTKPRTSPVIIIVSVSLVTLFAEHC